MSAKQNTRGLTLLELMFVVMIIAVVVAIALPPVMNLVGGFQARAAAASLETLIQETRMRSVRDDAIYSLAAVAWGNGAQGYCIVSQPGLLNPPVPGTADCLTQEQKFIAASNVQIIAEAAAPAKVPVTSNPQYAQLATSLSGANPPVLVTFNARGLPCQYNAGVCSTLLAGGQQVGYAAYFLYTPRRGSALYRAVTVTPAGRVRIWAYSSGVWQ